MNHDYAHCLDHDSAVCPSDCFRAQLVEDLRKRKDMVGIPVAWINFRHLSECALNIPKPTNYDRIVSKTPEELAEWIAGGVLNLTGGSLKMATEAWLDWLKREAAE